jgi:hypothetical protein
MLISNGWTDDLFPPDEAIRFYNRTRTNHPGTPISLIFTDAGHQRGQNKAVDAAFRSRARQAWFDFYLRGVGSQPFLGVQTLTKTCGGPSGGATGDFDDPDTDAPFQATTWAAFAPGEVRIESAAQQVISPSVPSDGPVGQAFDPITGGGACATASGADQTGAATYRSDPAPANGYTLMGSPTIVADILSPGPTSQIAARLLDVDPVSGNETLVARGLYRPEINTLTATCQVFQLHPIGWKFVQGHVAKLELLPADQPYGRNSNGQTAITVSNLRLRLPVLEQPDAGLIQDPSPKVLPAGYALAADVPPGVDSSCPASPTTTSTSVPPTTSSTSSTVPGTTSTTSTTVGSSTTTTTTLPATENLHVVRAKIHGQSGSPTGSIRLKGDFSTPPAFSFPPPFSVRVQDGGGVDRLHVFNDCVTNARGRVRCQDTSADGVFKATFKPVGQSPGVVRFKVDFLRQTLAGPFAAPVTVTLAHNSAVVRQDTISTCRQGGTTLSCREP